MAKHGYVGNCDIRWSANLAYGIGLIASDGNVHKNGKGILFKSAEEELMLKFRDALGITNNIGRSARGGESEKKYYYTQFSSVAFWRFLNSIGITPAKSKTIKSVAVPNQFFPDFLRGLFDGDGTFYSSWDKRWPRSFVFQASFASASYPFVWWLKEMLADKYGMKGFIRKGAGVYNLRYVKGDSKKLFSAMYYKPGLLFLSRKYDKMVKAFEYDNLLKSDANIAIAAVAQ
ncbi:MAG: LAGLIDADG family homing endonuclease [bacterium]|nr:LAGLIDADG family homing endonuclease [bacterium]